MSNFLILYGAWLNPILLSTLNTIMHTKKLYMTIFNSGCLGTNPLLLFWHCPYVLWDTITWLGNILFSIIPTFTFEEFPVCSLSYVSMDDIWRVGKQKETSLAWLSWLVFQIISLKYIHIFPVKWIRDQFPAPDGDYTGFTDIIVKNG